MTVADLIKHLEALDKDSVVVLSSDGEGNHFSPVAGFESEYYFVNEDSSSGELYGLERGETEEDLKASMPSARKAVVLYPIT